MKQKVEIMSMTDEILSPITKASNVLLEDGGNVQQLIDNYAEPEFTPTIENSSSMFKVGQGDNVDFSANVINGAYESCVLKGKTLVNYNAEGNDRNEYVCMPSVEGESVTVNGTVEGLVKSAILKGQTLVNLFDFKEPITVMTDRIRLFSSDSFKNRLSNGVHTIVNSSDKKISLDICNKSDDVWVKTVTLLGNQKTTVEFADTYIRFVSFMFSDGWSNSLEDEIKNTVVVLEGDYANCNIPYFTGMQSVKMPVLTTSNEDGTKTNILSTSEDVELRGIGNVRDELDLLTGELIQNIGEVVLDGNGFYVESQDDLTFTFAKDGNPVILQANKFLSNRFSNVTYVNGTIRVIVNKSEFKSIDDFKENLLTNNLIILFAKSQKSIKTVDLSDNHVYSYNDTTHYICSSAEGSLIPTLSIEEGVKYQAIIKPSTKYSIVFNRTLASDSLTVDLGGATANVSSTTTGKTIVQITTLPTLSHNYVKFTGVGNVIKDVQVIEGDVADDIEYFEGMIDVENPVLTTTEKNLLDISTLKNIRTDYDYTVGNYKCKKIKVEPNTTYTISAKASESVGALFFNNVSTIATGANYLDFRKNTVISKTYTTDDKGYLYVGTSLTDDAIIESILDRDIQIEQGRIATSYEPYKSNTITTEQSDGSTITLRRVGDVCDTLNLMIGEYVQRIGEVVLDGSEDWSRAKNTDETYRFGLLIDDMCNNKLPITSTRVFIKTDKFSIVEFTGETCPTTNSISAYGNVIVFYNIEKQELNDFKSWLQQNPVTVQYELETPITTTIDIKQHPYAYKDGYINLSSNSEKSLTPSIEYSLPINRSGQVTINTQLVQKQQKQLDELESMIIANMVNTQYKQTLSSVEYMLGGE